MVDFWYRFFTVYAEFFTAYKGRKRWKNISLLIWSFSRLVFHGLPPLEQIYMVASVLLTVCGKLGPHQSKVLCVTRDMHGKDMPLPSRPFVSSKTCACVNNSQRCAHIHPKYLPRVFEREAWIFQISILWGNLAGGPLFWSLFCRQTFGSKHLKTLLSADSVRNRDFFSVRTWKHRFFLRSEMCEMCQMFGQTFEMPFFLRNRAHFGKSRSFCGPVRTDKEPSTEPILEIVSVLVLFLVVVVVDVVVVVLLLVVFLFLLFYFCCFGCCWWLATEHPKGRKTKIP